MDADRTKYAVPPFPFLLETKKNPGLRTLEPYKRLAFDGSSPPQESILVESCVHPITATFSCLWWKHYFVAYIAFITLLAECLTVALSGVPFSSALSYEAYTVSTFLSVAIIAMMLITIPVIALRGRDLMMPRGLDNIVAVLLYICGSPMLASFGGYHC